MTLSARSRYTGYRFPPEIISHAVWLYFRFPLSLRMVEELLAARGIVVSHETVRQWAAQVRPGVRERDPLPPAAGRRQVALGRGRDHHRQHKTLALASG
jgi:putative transposase